MKMLSDTDVADRKVALVFKKNKDMHQKMLWGSVFGLMSC